MRSISLTSSARVFFSLLAAACCAQGVFADGENYSLWPRRPEALAEARRLMDRGSLPQALELLQPLVEQGGVVGKRRISSAACASGNCWTPTGRM